jgi:hypothetical protein
MESSTAARGLSRCLMGPGSSTADSQRSATAIASFTAACSSYHGTAERTYRSSTRRRFFQRVWPTRDTCFCCVAVATPTAVVMLQHEGEWSTVGTQRRAEAVLVMSPYTVSAVATLQQDKRYNSSYAASAVANPIAGQALQQFLRYSRGAHSTAVRRYRGGSASDPERRCSSILSPCTN